MIEERKKLVGRIEKGQEEFAKKMTDLLGVVNLLSATAAERAVNFKFLLVSSENSLKKH